MFVVVLRFSTHKTKAGQRAAAHNAWILRGFDDGVFLLGGGLQPGLGGVVVAHRVTRADLERRIGEDPFVVDGIVTAEILEVAPSRTDERLAFLAAR